MLSLQEGETEKNTGNMNTTYEKLNYRTPALRVIDIVQQQGILSDSMASGEPYDDQEYYDGF